MWVLVENSIISIYIFDSKYQMRLREWNNSYYVAHVAQFISTNTIEKLQSKPIPYYSRTHTYNNNSTMKWRKRNNNLKTGLHARFYVVLHQTHSFISRLFIAWLPPHTRSSCGSICTDRIHIYVQTADIHSTFHSTAIQLLLIKHGKKIFFRLQTALALDSYLF